MHRFLPGAYLSFKKTVPGDKSKACSLIQRIGSSMIRWKTRQKLQQLQPDSPGKLTLGRRHQKVATVSNPSEPSPLDV